MDCTENNHQKVKVFHTKQWLLSNNSSIYSIINLVYHSNVFADISKSTYLWRWISFPLYLTYLLIGSWFPVQIDFAKQSNWVRYYIFICFMLCDLAAGAARHTHLNHWGRMTHICVGKPIIIASRNGLSPGRRQVIICTNPAILSIGPNGAYFNEVLF